MDSEKSESVGSNNTEKTMAQAESEALKKCLEENKGESQANCKSKFEAFQSSSHPKKPLGRLSLTTGSLTEV
ncbi:hypothetical protein Patl1_00450 [Pistacia atlantica]|uniref:Uncharacterized protein n=1 Tax=Pistacia atlantica TaxID=434234 RepID=A0ACC1CCK6_9ROSI|nr:hypothetical protein Patl1_00450 [Pistacia atlantica]